MTPLFSRVVFACALTLSCSVVAHADEVQLMFTEVSALVGIDHVQHSYTEISDPNEAALFEIRFMTGAAAAGDYDGDGWTDLFITRIDAPDILYRNLGNGSFADVSAEAGFTDAHSTNGAAFADIDNDGDRDLFVMSLLETRAYLYINDGLGHFTEDAIARGAAMDDPGLHVVFSVAAGDYDNDGRVDFHADEWASVGISRTRLLRNTGGTFDDQTSLAEVSASGVRAFASRFADLDNDGWVDLPIAGDFGTSRLFWNDQDGTFTNGTTSARVATDENGMGSAVGDFDNDGDLDWFVTSIFDPDQTCETQTCMWGYTGNRLYRNEGGRLFFDATDEKGVRDGGWGWGAAFWDYDNDGDLDLVMTNGQQFLGTDVEASFNDDALRLWRNDGPGLMTEVAAAAGLTDARPGKGLLTFDYDNDGDLDLFIVNNGDTPVLYRNNLEGSHWLRVELEGTRSVRDAFGARVYVTAAEDGVTQMREISGGSHFLGQSETIAHFGLGTHDSLIHEVRVVWPASGEVQVFSNVAPNQLLKVLEPFTTPDLDAGVLDSGDSDTDTDSDSATDTDADSDSTTDSAPDTVTDTASNSRTNCAIAMNAEDRESKLSLTTCFLLLLARRIRNKFALAP